MPAKIKLARELNENDKIAPQAKVLIDKLSSIGVGKEVDRDEFVKQIEAEGNLKTKQPVARILAYYTPLLSKEGLIEIIKIAKPKAEKKEKPAKSPAEAPAKPAKAVA